MGVTFRSSVRLVLFLITITFPFVVLYVLVKRAADGDFHPDVAASTIFLYLGAVVAVVLSAAAGRGNGRLWFHVVLAVLTRCVVDAVDG
ncbi:hypothetical protein GCU60_08795 [Blastococcus saxobsidens]|uniref:Uncharacterized protein n=1 Tax=Blastococcus saxobsidens TaxID=138336 RepID=A0A6L9W1L0_9ACTN|nr:hypothetical protein [Blastococcus saxobsidens]NEK85858.1 hypothetical protein [Blastococcus saxobsidens]